MGKKKETCLIDECDNPVHSRRMCASHYVYGWRHGWFHDLRKHGQSNGRRKTKTREGYILVWDGARYVGEHRQIMEEVIGRPLLPGENVHHRNGVRDDNRPENLELWVVHQPAGQRPEDLLEWADEIIRRYRPNPETGVDAAPE